MKESEAIQLGKFLMEMLQWNPKNRGSAQKLLKHSWLKMDNNYEAFMTRDHSREWKKLNLPDNVSSSSSSEEAAPQQQQEYTDSEEEEDLSGEYESEDEEDMDQEEVERPNLNAEDPAGNTIY